jgi:RNA polymerase sigma-70 factor (ECF subfamily)
MADVTPDSAETQRLLHQVCAGDASAFDALFARHRSYVRQVIELRLDPRLRARVDPSDVVQETQLDAFRRLPDYLERRPMAFRLWLRKTACERDWRSVPKVISWPRVMTALRQMASLCGTSPPGSSYPLPCPHRLSAP